jgi:PD-(D/E)XK nuclease superfamily
MSKLTINFGPEFRNKVAISPSRCDTLTHCSQKYYANYFLRIPDKGNPGSSRGSTVHDIMEYLAQNENRPLREELLKLDTLVGSPIWERAVSLASKYNVSDEENLGLIDQFIITALKYDRPPENTKEELAEVPFDFEVSGDGIDFRVRGKMDKLYIIEGGKGKKKKSLYINYLDYKSSRSKFSEDKIQGNLQGGIYQYALSVLYPELELKRFDFLFLKFGDDPIQEFKLLGKEEMEGFHLYLTDVQETLNNFSEKNVGDNLGILKYETKFLCGPSKKSGWICPHQLPLTYWVLTDYKGEIITSGFTEEELIPKLKDGLKIEKRFYSGCIWFYNPDGKKRTLTREY